MNGVGYATKKGLGTPRLAEDDLTLLTGEMVRLRGMSRAESVEIAELQGAEYEAKAIHLALVQPDGLTLEDVKAWQKAAPSKELLEVVSKILSLSGLGPDAGKAAYKSVREQP